MTELVYRMLEKTLTRKKGRPYVLDRKIPLRVLLAVVVRRSAWLLRGIVKTLVLQGRPRAVFIAPSGELRNASLIHFGHGVTLERGVIIDGLSLGGIVLEDNATLGAYSIVRASMLSHVGEGVRLGRNSSCEAYSFIGAAGEIRIGENVIMGQHVSMHAENHNFRRTDLPIRMQGVRQKGIVVEDDCWIGANVTLLDGCHIGQGCVIAAGAVVRGEIPAFSVVAGVPARVLRSRVCDGVLEPAGTPDQVMP